jgi:hypothetical protein
MPLSVFNNDEQQYLRKFVDGFVKAKGSHHTLDFVCKAFRDYEKQFNIGTPLPEFQASKPDATPEALAASWRLRRLMVGTLVLLLHVCFRIQTTHTLLIATLLVAHQPHALDFNNLKIWPPSQAEAGQDSQS